MALSAVVAWLIALTFFTQQSFIAPYAAVFMVASTVYRSVESALQQTVTLILGGTLAYVAITTIGQPVAALAIAVFVGALIGRWHRFGDSGVAVTALLMLTYGTAHESDFLLVRVGESLVGAAVGLAVNILILPPVQLRGLERAVVDLARDTRRLLEDIADGLNDSWDRDDAGEWSRRARTLDQAIRRAEMAMSHGHESTRLNPWQQSCRRMSPAAYEPAVDDLRETTGELKRMTSSLSHSSENAVEADFAAEVATMLRALARAMACYQTQTGSLRQNEIRHVLESLPRPRKRLAAQLTRGQFRTAMTANVEGAILLALDRIVHVLAKQR